MRRDFVNTELGWPSTWTNRLDRDRTPSIPGHELAGMVTALGYGTTGLSVRTAGVRPHRLVSRRPHGGRDCDAEEVYRLCVGDLKSRRVEIQHVSSDRTVVNASVPLANMFGYINQLRAFSAGRVVFKMRFDRYEQAPWEDHDPPFRPAIGMRA